MKNSQIITGVILIAVIAGAAYFLTKGTEPAPQAAVPTEAPAAAPEGVAPEATECTQYSLVVGAWVCTSGH